MKDVLYFLAIFHPSRRKKIIRKTSKICQKHHYYRPRKSKNLFHNKIIFERCLIFFSNFPPFSKEKKNSKTSKICQKHLLLSAKSVDKLFDNKASFEKNIDLVTRKSILYKITSYFWVLFRLFWRLISVFLRELLNFSAFSLIFREKKTEKYKKSAINSQKITR